MTEIIVALAVFVLLVLTVFNTVLAISSSMTLIKVFEFLKMTEERAMLEDERQQQLEEKRQQQLKARGLVDIISSQIPYSVPQNVK